MTAATPQRLFGRNEIAKKLRVHSNTVRRAFLSGSLRGMIAGDRWHATYTDLAAWLGAARARELFGEQSERASGIAQGAVGRAEPARKIPKPARKRVRKTIRKKAA